MANLDDMNKSLNDIIVKLEWILELQDKAIKNNIVLQTRVAEQRDAPVHAEQDVAFWTCSACGMYNYNAWKTCAKCNAPHPNRSAGG